ncbi:MAG: YkgJ family cysteine cluster protein [Nitrospinota bacterium]
MDNLNNRSYFFDNGIRFECQQCGACCTGSPGTIYVDKSEVSSIAKFLQISVSDFKEKYLYPFKNSYSILEHSDGQCFFYNGEYKIYPVRPGQCSSYPFWFTNLRSEKKWQSVSKECRGIGQGRLYSKKKILEIVQTTFPWIMNSLFGAERRGGDLF